MPKTVITPEWCERMAKLEGDAEIGAGLVARDPTWCSLCGAATPDQTQECDVCRKWWSDNPPPAGDSI